MSEAGAVMRSPGSGMDSPAALREGLLAFCQAQRALEYASQDPDAAPEFVTYAAGVIERAPLLHPVADYAVGLLTDLIDMSKTQEANRRFSASATLGNVIAEVFRLTRLALGEASFAADERLAKLNRRWRGGPFSLEECCEGTDFVTLLEQALSHLRLLPMELDFFRDCLGRDPWLGDDMMFDGSCNTPGLVANAVEQGLHRMAPSPRRRLWSLY